MESDEAKMARAKRLAAELEKSESPAVRKLAQRWRDSVAQIEEWTVEDSDPEYRAPIHSPDGSATCYFDPAEAAAEARRIRASIREGIRERLRREELNDS